MSTHMYFKSLLYVCVFRCDFKIVEKGKKALDAHTQNRTLVHRKNPALEGEGLPWKRLQTSLKKYKLLYAHLQLCWKPNTICFFFFPRFFFFTLNNFMSCCPSRNKFPRVGENNLFPEARWKFLGKLKMLVRVQADLVPKVSKSPWSPLRVFNQPFSNKKAGGGG